MTPNPTADATNWTPTDAAPGSAEKVAVMEERARLGLPLFHPHDSIGAVEQRYCVPDGCHYANGDERNIHRRKNGRYFVKVSRNHVQHYVGYFRGLPEAIAARDAYLASIGELELAS